MAFTRIIKNLLVKKTYRSAKTMRKRSELPSILKKPNAFRRRIAHSGGGGTISKARDRAAEGQCANGQAENGNRAAKGQSANGARFEAITRTPSGFEATGNNSKLGRRRDNKQSKKPSGGRTMRKRTGRMQTERRKDKAQTERASKP